MNKTDLAFPYTDFDENHKGLTKREYIATQILTGLLASCIRSFPDAKYIATEAIEYTDELLKQLSE